jgi:hypothetical protein
MQRIKLISCLTYLVICTKIAFILVNSVPAILLSVAVGILKDDAEGIIDRFLDVLLLGEGGRVKRHLLLLLSPPT